MLRWTFVLLATFWPAAAMAAVPAAPDGGAAVLLRLVLVLGGVCLLAFVTLKWGLKRFVSPNATPGGGMRVIARLPVEPRRSILVVRVANRVLVLGSTEAGFESLGELGPEEASALESKPSPEPRSFASVMAAIRPTDVSRETIAPEEP